MPSRPAPPLPPHWPYPPRVGTAPPERQDDVALPGLPGRWRLEAVPGLDLSQPGTPLGGAFGRGGVLRAGSLVLRPYQRGGLLRHVNRNIYAGPERFQQEFLVHRALWDAGLPTVEPLGWAHRPRLWGSEGVFLTRFTAAQPWPRAWDRLAPAKVRQLLQALCAWGLRAPDLNATNFLVDSAGDLLALDWDGARWAPGADLPARYQERLLRSLRKLGAPEELIAALG